MHTFSCRLLLAVLASATVLTGCDAAATPQQTTHSEGAPTVTTQTGAAGTLTPRIVGQTENAHRAVLNRELAGTGVDYEQWVVLILTSGAGAPIDRQRLVGEAGHGLKDPQAADSAVTALIEINLLNPVAGQPPQLSLTDAGRAIVARVSKSTNDIIARAYAAVSPADLATAGQVLTTITGQLDQVLTRK